MQSRIDNIFIGIMFLNCLTLCFSVHAYEDPVEDSILLSGTDPVRLEYSSFLDGSGTAIGRAIAMDTAGSLYVAGSTESLDFPTCDSFQGSHSGGRIDLVITKYRFTGTNIVIEYSTYMGGSGEDDVFDMFVDGDGNAYFTGSTYSSDFPTYNAFQGLSRRPMFASAYVTKLNAAGTDLVYSTYLGGSSRDIGQAITADNIGNAILTGLTYSDDFPTHNAIQQSWVRFGDAFVAKLGVDGSDMLFSTYLGGFSEDEGAGIMLDNTGNIVIAGYTESWDFPTKNAFQGARAGIVTNSDIFITKLHEEGQAIICSTFFGGSENDRMTGNGLAVDASGGVYISGSTDSPNFPTRSAFQKRYRGSGGDGFVARFDTGCSDLIYSTYLGSYDRDECTGIGIDNSGFAYVTGHTYSPYFPTCNAYQKMHAGGYGDVFVTRLAPDGLSLEYSTFFGGMDADSGEDMLVDKHGNVYITGFTYSPDLPTLNAYQKNLNGASDIFIAKFTESEMIPVSSSGFLMLSVLLICAGMLIFLFLLPHSLRCVL